jgi:hypothetical protein
MKTLNIKNRLFFWRIYFYTLFLLLALTIMYILSVYGRLFFI